MFVLPAVFVFRRLFQPARPPPVSHLSKFRIDNTPSNGAALEHLSQSELRALLEAARSVSERDWLMILTGYWHGLRASEVVGHRRRDKVTGKYFGAYVGGLRGRDVADGHITVARLKGSLKTTQPLIPHADPLLDEATALARWADSRLTNERLFPISRVRFRQIIQRYGKMAGIAKRLCHPHILKHSVAMHSIRAAGIENLKQYLGHKSGASTMAYLKVDDGQASRAVMDALGAGRPVQMGLGFNVVEMPRKEPRRELAQGNQVLHR